MDINLKALILNSGMGTRMSGMTSNIPKCLVRLADGDTILERQLRQLRTAGIRNVVMTTGYLAETIEEACARFADSFADNSSDGSSDSFPGSSSPKMNFEFVHNPDYSSTNYIYSIYLAREKLRGDIIKLHGDLVFDDELISDMLSQKDNCMAVSDERPLPEKDFKAVIHGGKVTRVDIHTFENALYAQPIYKLSAQAWALWLDEIVHFCESDIKNCYSEEAFNKISDKISIFPYNVKMRLCMEIDTPEDLAIANKELSDTGEHL